MKTPLGILMVITACGGPEEDPLRIAVMDAMVNEVALSQMKGFESKSSKMASAALQFCDDPSALELLEEVQVEWWETKGALKRLELIHFGPIVEYPERLGPKIDDWPVNEAAVDELLDSSSVLEPEAFYDMGSATRGMPVIEYLLWSRGEQATDFFTNSERPCQALVGATNDLNRNASRLKEVWVTDWVGPLTQPSLYPDDDYETLHDVLEEWVSRMSFTVENIRKEKLGKPVGDSAGGEPQPDTLESPYSKRSITDAYDALLGVQDAWSGGSFSDLGIQNLLAEDWRGTLDTSELFRISLERLKEIPEPLAETILMEPEIVARAQEALLALQVAIQVDLAQALSVQVGFNDNDGD